MAQQHLFILDPLAALNPQLDTSLGLAAALHAAGCEVWWCTLHDLSWNSNSHYLEANAQRLGFTTATGRQAEAYGPRVFLAGNSFNGIHLRKDPPVDYTYLATTWLLDSLAGSKTRVFNTPAAVRSINEKLGIFLFPKASHPALVSADPQQLLAYLRNDCHGDAISKPLDSFGGRGVERISLAELSVEQAAALLASHTEQGQRLRMLQPFCAEIFSGEVRAFAVGGTVLAWCLKRPAAESYLANTRAGAQLAAYHPSKELAADINRIARRLWHAFGIAFVGFDIIAGKISEVNLTSPRLLQGADDSTDYFTPMAQWVSKHSR